MLRSVFFSTHDLVNNPQSIIIWSKLQSNPHQGTSLFASFMLRLFTRGTFFQYINLISYEIELEISVGERIEWVDYVKGEKHSLSTRCACVSHRGVDQVDRERGHFARMQNDSFLRRVVWVITNESETDSAPVNTATRHYFCPTGLT